MNQWVNVASVAAGGAIGASARFAVGVWLVPVGRLPWSIVTVNVLGCLTAGFVSTVMMQRAQLSEPLQLFIITGFLGGFTTFSAFSVDTLRLAEAGQPGIAMINILINVLGSLSAVAIGWWLARLF